MIKSISVSNFRSIKDKITLDLSKSKRKKSNLPNYVSVSNTEIATTSVIYGANASGKSNLLKAFHALRYLVLASTRFKLGDKLEPYEPFKLAQGLDTQPVAIELEFFIERTRYIYSIVLREKYVEEEKLVFFPTRREALLFHRIKGENIQFSDYFKGEKKIIEKLTLPNQLFLSKAAENNAESVLKVFQFFKDHLKVYSFSNEHEEAQLKGFYAKRLADKPESSFAKKLNALICALDTGINSIKVEVENYDLEEHPISKSFLKTIKKSISRYSIQTIHEMFDENNKPSKPIEFDINEESTGTRRLLSIGGLIIDALEKGSVLIIDEFEKNLHPIITTYLIKLFQQEIFNPKNAQLIFATHDVTQLNEELFNRDQVWFTQKNEFGATELIRCSDIKGLRLNAPLDKWYLSGRLGGTAIINDVDFVIAMQESTEE